jgi:hypothetical protein
MPAFESTVLVRNWITGSSGEEERAGRQQGSVGHRERPG